MKSENIIKEYIEYKNKIGNRKVIYRTVVDHFNIESILYPGSHIDIAPSFIIPKVIYVDNFKGAIGFFKHIDVIKGYIEEHKEYDEPIEIAFKGQDYTKALDIEPVDLIISQYAGFVGQATKQYLKKGGILLSNDSHGDATLANFDNDYKLIGIIDKSNRIIESDLNKYFKLSKGKNVDLEKVYEKMKGPNYLVKAENYLFLKMN